MQLKSKNWTCLQKLPRDRECLGVQAWGREGHSQTDIIPCSPCYRRYPFWGRQGSPGAWGWLALLLVLSILCSSLSNEGSWFSESNFLFSCLMHMSWQPSPWVPRRWLVVQAATSRAAQSTLDLAVGNYLCHLNGHPFLPPFFSTFSVHGLPGFLAAQIQLFSVPPLPVLSPSPFILTSVKTFSIVSYKTY